MESQEGQTLKSSVALRLLLDLQYDGMVFPGRAYLASASRGAQFIEEL